VFLNRVKRIFWRRIDKPGTEIADLTEQGRRWRVSGAVQVVHGGAPWAVSYTIECGSDWKTGTVEVHLREGDNQKTLRLNADSGEWTVDGEPRSDLNGCLDVDLGFTPSTNLLPIRRLDLAIGESADVRAAWVRFPELTTSVLEQRYTRLRKAVYLYQSNNGKFRRELTVDDSGLVLEYPDFFHAEAVTGRL
jgi:hypothetical protein